MGDIKITLRRTPDVSYLKKDDAKGLDDVLLMLYEAKDDDEKVKSILENVPGIYLSKLYKDGFVDNVEGEYIS